MTTLTLVPVPGTSLYACQNKKCLASEVALPNEDIVEHANFHKANTIETIISDDVKVVSHKKDSSDTSFYDPNPPAVEEPETPTE